MKAGKKIQKKAEQRSIAHNVKRVAFGKSTSHGVLNPDTAFKSPGSRNKKKIGAC